MATPTGWFLDVGCGRVFVALDALKPEVWASITQNIISFDGHAQLEKSPESFRREKDIYGDVTGTERGVMHKIKKALDPGALFAPGRLPKIKAANA